MLLFYESFSCCMYASGNLSPIIYVLKQISSQEAETLNGVSASFALEYRNQGEEVSTELTYTP